MNVLFVDTVHEVLSERLTQNGFNCIHAENFTLTEIENHLANVNGLVIRSRFPVDTTFLEKCPHLKFIARSGAGMENIDVEFCERHNIRLFNSPEGNRNAVGEHALAMLLALFNKLHISTSEVKNRIWNREKNRGVELDGKTVGIIGYGNNGQAFARKLRGFDTKVLVYDKYKNNFGNEHVTESTLAEIYTQADVISFHVPQNKETISYFNQDFLDQMAKPFYLINVARGKVVNSRIVVAGLKTEKIIGACLDVLDYENGSFEDFIEHEHANDFEYLLNSDKTLITPHVAGWTTESYFKLSSVLSDKILTTFLP